MPSNIQTRKLPIKGDPFKNVEEEELTEVSAELIDAFTDESGSTVKRPGIATMTDLGTGYPVEGLWWCERLGCVFAVSNGRIWKITSIGGAKTELTTSGDQLRNYAATGGIGKVSFCDDGTYIFMANGGNICYTNGTAQSDHVDDVDADAPTAVNQVVYHDKYLIASVDQTGKIQFSNVGDSLAWDAADFATAEGSPDNLKFLGAAWRELLLAGEESIEVWYNDGSSPFSRLEGAYTEGGTESANTVCLIQDGSWVFLDRRRRFVLLQGRRTQAISTPFDKYIQTLSAVSDATSYAVEISGRKFYITSFPTANKTIVWDYTKMDLKQGWSEWASWTGSAYNRYWGHTHTYARGFGVNLIGSKDDGKVYKLSPDYLDDNGAAIRLLRRTGHIDHGISSKKRSNMVRIRVRRGEANAYVTSPVLKYRWNDDNAGFGDWQSIDLGQSTDTEFIVKLQRLGIYRTRQWEFVQDQRCGLVLVDAEEDFEVLGR